MNSKENQSEEQSETAKAKALQLRESRAASRMNSRSREKLRTRAYDLVLERLVKVLETGDSSSGEVKVYFDAHMTERTFALSQKKFNFQKNGSRRKKKRLTPEQTREAIHAMVYGKETE